MVTWFAGLFYLPRLFVYHAQTTDREGDERFKIMERKLFWGIMTPGGVLTIVFGFAMLIPQWEVYAPYGWMDAKLFIVGLLVIYHVWCGVCLKRFRDNANVHSHTWYRWFNEVPTVGLIAIILLAVLRPW